MVNLHAASYTSLGRLHGDSPRENHRHVQLGSRRILPGLLNGRSGGRMELHRPKECSATTGVYI